MYHQYRLPYLRIVPHAISAIFTSDEELIDIASRGRTHCRSHIPAGRCTDCHRQFLPKHREGENQYLLVADTPITVSVAGTTDIPALLWAGRHLDMYAGIGLLCFCNGSGGIVDICKEITHRNYRKAR